MSVAALAVGLLAFILVLRLCRAQQLATDVIQVTHTALGTMANGTLDDHEKERRVRKASLRLFRDFLLIAAVAIGACAAAALVVWGGAEIGLYTLEHAIEVAMGWPFILTSSVAAVLLWIGMGRLHAPATDPGDESGRTEVPYNGLDRALHDYAFASPERQRRLGDLETRLYRGRIDPIRAERPVFITSLPRAGTTILLELLADVPDLASATYRHMPFTLAPLLWGGFSGAFRKAGEKAERAHGDGIETGFDSPEAFEEMLWTTFWPDHYRDGVIRPWSATDRDPEFEAFFRTHLAKIVATKPGARRYVSKNNANIARLGLLEEICPDATILIPVRNPRAQVASLLGQHRRFSELHAREPFARRYMEGIGHFEFGEALKPIAFGNADRDRADAESAEFWVRYWSDAYEAVLSTAGSRAVFLDYDALCAAPERHLPSLAGAVGLSDPARLAAMAQRLRPSRPGAEPEGVAPGLMSRADDIHAALLARCAIPDGAVSMAS